MKPSPIMPPKLVHSSGRLPTFHRSPAPLQSQHLPHHCKAHYSTPRLIQPSVLNSLIPKPLRRTSPSSSQPHRPRQRQPNPATPFLLLSLLTGSQAINLISLKSQMRGYTRTTDARLAALRDVVERMQRGETDVDVEGLLGTGRPEDEKAWEEVVRELQEADRKIRNGDFSDVRERRSKPKSKEAVGGAASEGPEENEADGREAEEATKQESRRKTFY